MDGESKEVKYFRTVKRIPEEQRWDPNNLEWITVVPWNRGGGDKEYDGDLPEFDVKNGPVRQLTEDEKQDIMRDEAPQIIHRAHFRQSDFDNHGYTDRCPVCSAILRGLHVQHHTADGNGKRQKSEKSVLVREQASGSHQSATYAEVGVEKITESNVDPWEFLEAVGSDNNNTTQCLKTLGKPRRRRVCMGMTSTTSRFLWSWSKRLDRNR